MEKTSFIHQKRTMLAFIFQGVFFFIGYCFFDVNTVIPVFIETLTGKPELAGVASTIRQFSTLLLQFLMGAYIVKIKNVPRYLFFFLFVGYAMPLALTVPMLLGANSMAVALYTFAAVAVMWICDGFVVIGYYDLLGRTVSSANRARVLGYQQLIGGAGAVLGAYAVKRLLDAPQLAFTQKYTAIFAIGGCILLLGAFSMLFAKDTESRVVKTAYSLPTQLKDMLGCIRKNPAFKRVMLCQICFTCAMMIAPYVLLMCMDTGDIQPEFMSTLLNLQVIGTLVGGAASAFLAPKHGNTLVVVVYCVLCCACGGFGFLTACSIGATGVNMVVTAVTAGIASASWAGFMNLIIDISKGKNTHAFMLVNSVVSLPLSVSTIVAGQIAKHFGYAALFLIALVLAAAALFLAVRIFMDKKKDSAAYGR